MSQNIQQIVVLVIPKEHILIFKYKYDDDRNVYKKTKLFA